MCLKLQRREAPSLCVGSAFPLPPGSATPWQADDLEGGVRFCTDPGRSRFRPFVYAWAGDRGRCDSRAEATLEAALGWGPEVLLGDVTRGRPYATACGLPCSAPRRTLCGCSGPVDDPDRGYIGGRTPGVGS